MKRNRLWWIAGVGLLVILIALGWRFSGDSRPPAVSVSVVGFTNVTMPGRRGAIVSRAVAVVEVSNRSSVTLEVSASLQTEIVERHRFAGPGGSLVLGMSQLPVVSFPGEAARLEVVMMSGVSRPYWVDVTYEPLTASARLRRWLSWRSSVTVQKWAAQVLPPPGVHRRRIGPLTNYPPREMLPSVWDRLETLNSLSTNVAGWSAMMRTNVLLLGTNKPPAEVNPGGGLKRWEF